MHSPSMTRLLLNEVQHHTATLVDVGDVGMGAAIRKWHCALTGRWGEKNQSKLLNELWKMMI